MSDFIQVMLAGNLVSDISVERNGNDTFGWVQVAASMPYTTTTGSTTMAPTLVWVEFRGPSVIYEMQRTMGKGSRVAITGKLYQRTGVTQEQLPQPNSTQMVEVIVERTHYVLVPSNIAPAGDALAAPR